MVFVKVHCYNCGADYEIHNLPEYNACPHCCQLMPDKAFNKLTNAVMTLEEVNKDLRVAHDEHGAPLFQIELRNHYVSAEKYKLAF